MELSPFEAEHEEGLSFFVEGSHRPRFRESLASPKRRTKLIATLDHFAYLDRRWAYDASTLSTQEVAHYLRKHGAPKTCYVLSSHPDYLRPDESEGWKFILGTTADLDKAVEALAYAGFGAFISCVPGQLAYFTGEMPDERFILQRPPA